MRAMRMSKLTVAAAVLLCALPVQAEDEKKRTRAEWAALAKAAYAEGEEAVLKEVAATRSTLRWPVVDALCAEDALDVAEALARLSPEPEAEAIQGYVAQQRKSPTATPRRQARDEMIRLLSAGKSKEAIEAGAGAIGDMRDVVGIEARADTAAARWRSGDLPGALTDYDAAGKAAHAIGWLGRAADCEYKAAQAAAKLRRFDAAEARYRTALGTYEKARDLRGQGDALNGLGLVLTSQRRIDDALDVMMRGLEVAEQIEDRLGQAILLNSIGAARLEKGQLARGLRAFQETLAILEQLKHPFAPAIESNIGVVYMQMGRYNDALKYLESALHKQEKRNDKSGLRASYNRLGAAYSDMGDLDRAIETLERAAKLAEEIGDEMGLAYAFNNLGSAYQRSGEFNRALEAAQRSLAIKEKLGEPAKLISSYINLADVARQTGDLPLARKHADRALALAKETDDRWNLPIAIRSQAHILEDGGEHAAALQQFQKSALLSERQRASHELALSLLSVARVQLKLGDSAAALATAKRTVPLLDQLAGGLAEQQGALARSTFTRLFAIGLQAAVREQNDAEALFFLESGRAGSLLESLDGGRMFRSHIVPEDPAQGRSRGPGRGASGPGVLPNRAGSGEAIGRTRERTRGRCRPREGRGGRRTDPAKGEERRRCPVPEGRDCLRGPGRAR